MPLFEDLEGRVAKIEALGLYRLPDYMQAVLDVKKQTEANGRRLGQIEEALPARVESEVGSLSRRVHALEDAWGPTKFEVLAERLDGHQHELPTHEHEHQHQLEQHEHDLTHSHDEFVHQHTELEERLAGVEQFMLRQRREAVEWAGLPWYKRFWLLLSGRVH